MPSKAYLPASQVVGYLRLTDRSGMQTARTNQKCDTQRRGSTHTWVWGNLVTRVLWEHEIPVQIWIPELYRKDIYVRSRQSYVRL